MKLTAKNLPVMLRLSLLFMIIVTLVWELLERLLGFAGVALDLSLGPIGFDLEVIALWLRVNPGTLLGVLPAILLFRRL